MRENNQSSGILDEIRTCVFVILREASQAEAARVAGLTNKNEGRYWLIYWRFFRQRAQVLELIDDLINRLGEG